MQDFSSVSLWPYFFLLSLYMDGSCPHFYPSFYSAACSHSILEHNETVIMKITLENRNLCNFSVGPLLISGAVFTSWVTAAELDRG